MENYKYYIRVHKHGYTADEYFVRDPNGEATTTKEITEATSFEHKADARDTAAAFSKLGFTVSVHEQRVVCPTAQYCFSADVVSQDFVGYNNIPQVLRRRMYVTHLTSGDPALVSTTLRAYRFIGTEISARVTAEDFTNKLGIKISARKDV